MNRIKVFHVISHFDVGGAEKVAFNIACSHNAAIEYHMVAVLKATSQYAKDFKQEIGNSGIRIHQSLISNNKLGIILFPFWFLVTYIIHKPNVIHTHTEIPDLSVFLFCKLFGWLIRKRTKIVRTIHNNVLWNKWGKIGLVVERFYKRQRRNIAISLSTQKSYTEKYQQLCPIIYNGINIPKEKKFKSIHKGKINIAFAGRLEYQKGIPVLAEVIYRLKDDERFYFHVIGSGSMEQNLLEQLNECRNFTHYKRIYGLADYLHNFDYLFMPSLFEGLALMPIEAGFSKTPTIINSCVGLEETMPEDWPLKVQDNRVDDYIAIFNSLPQLDYNELQDKVFAFVSQKFSIEEMQKQYEKIYLNGIRY